MDWKDFCPDSQGSIDIAKARACHNKLAITCESSEVLKYYKICLTLRKTTEPPRIISADLIVDLRNAIQRELGFGSEIDENREEAWIVSFGASPSSPFLEQSNLFPEFE